MPTLPWVTQEFEETRKIMGANFWPYGVEPNRKELELVMRYAYEQGLVNSSKSRKVATVNHSQETYSLYTLEEY